MTSANIPGITTKSLELFKQRLMLHVEAEDSRRNFFIEKVNKCYDSLISKILIDGFHNRHIIGEWAEKLFDG